MAEPESEADTIPHELGALGPATSPLRASEYSFGKSVSVPAYTVAWRWAMSLLSSSFLPGEPRGGRGSMIGAINGQEFGVAALNTTVQHEARSGLTTFRSSIGHIPASVGEWGPPAGLEPGAGRARVRFPGDCRPPPRAGSKPKWT